jgi:hypothetical protein
MLGHRRRLDKIVREQLYPAATTRGGLRHRRRADGLCVLDLGGADSHLQSNLWRRGDRLSPGGLLDASSTGSGAPPAASGAPGVDFCIGTPAGMSPPSASAPVKEKTSASATTTTPRGAPRLQKSTHLRQRWPPATVPRQPVARAPLE